MLQQFIQSGNFHPLTWLLVVIGYLMPFPLAYIALHLWHHYRQERFIAGMQWILLEIQVPRDVNKTPAAMELIFSNALFHKSKKGVWETYVTGAPWFWFSLEMVSIDGHVHFFIRTPSRLRNLIETQIYAQYPQAKVVEVDDYVFHVPRFTKHGDWYMWGCEFKKDKPDFYPIKTWVDFGDEMKTGIKEEFKIDPLTPTIEFLGSLAKGQQVWLQIVVRQSIKTYHSHKTGKHIQFHDAAWEEIERLTWPYTRRQKNDDNEKTFALDARVPEFLKTTVNNMVTQLDFLHFDCGIRLTILSNKKLVSEEKFNELRRDARLIFRQFAMPNDNQIERCNSTGFDSPWADPTGLVTTKLKRRALDWYRLRVFFHPPLRYATDRPKLISAFAPTNSPKIFVLSTRELSTLFHFPGLVSETPTFKRIESKIAKPPSNLPS